MTLLHHPLIDEFPDKKDQMHALKMSSSKFRRLAHEYEGIDKSIVRAEQGIEIVNDDYLAEIKKERLHLKDVIYQMINNQ